MLGSYNFAMLILCGFGIGFSDFLTTLPEIFCRTSLVSFPSTPLHENTKSGEKWRRWTGGIPSFHVLMGMKDCFWFPVLVVRSSSRNSDGRRALAAPSCTVVAPTWFRHVVDLISLTKEGDKLYACMPVIKKRIPWSLVQLLHFDVE